MIKQLSIGLAVSILIDATIVRLLLVPAVTYLFGTASWWIPRWLDRLLPHIDVESAPGRKDAEKMRRFIAAAREAAAKL